MQELNQVFRPKDAPAPQQKEQTATEILERDWMAIPMERGLIEEFRNKGQSDEEILAFMESYI